MEQMPEERERMLAHLRQLEETNWSDPAAVAKLFMAAARRQEASWV